MNTKIENDVIIASLNSKSVGKLINRISGSRLLISSLPGLALRTHVESLGKPRDVNKRSQSLPGKLDIKRHSPSILYSSVSIHINCGVASCLINVVYLTAYAFIRS